MVKTACIIADLHGHPKTMRFIELAVKRGCDYILIAGDITSADLGNSPSPVFSFLDSLGIPVIAVLGNSDRLEFLDDYAGLSNVKILHFSSEYIGDRLIIGVSGVQTQDHGSFYYLTDAQFYHGLKRVYEDRGKPEHFILLSHAPPYGYADEMRDGEHIGSRGLRRFDNEFAPDIHICGHVHEARGIYSNGKTTVINPGIQRPDQPVLTLNIPEMSLGILEL